MSNGSTSGLSTEHAEFLRAQAVDIELAESLGVRSLLTRADNPQEGVWANWANHPAVLFPWTGTDGRVEYQVRPDNPTNDHRGRPRKYVFQKEMTPVLWAVKVVENPARIAIVEGTKQCLAAASYAPADTSIYGISGCRSWQYEGMPLPELAVVEDLPVVVVFDADAATNPQVYEAGSQFADALAAEGAQKVLFARMIGADKAGLDDVLGRRPAAGRAKWFARLLDTAKPKPADKVPKGKAKQAEPEDGDRPVIVVNDDRHLVINALTEALLERWNTRQLFCFGGALARLTKAEMKPIGPGAFNDLVQETARTMSRTETKDGEKMTFQWPDSSTMTATLSRADHFASLDRISHAPFVRPDGSIVTEPGYDETTRTMLVPDEVFAGIEVPDAPTADQVAAARRLLLTEWWGDMPFDPISQANALALAITPAIRGLVPKVPLAVVDGLQMGVGKNLVADTLTMVYTGEAARPMNWVDENDEVRKQITSAFRTGQEFFVFDEAHTLQGAALAQALTASTWQDRILGVSTMADFPNKVTWISLGNQVQVKGDITRRVYRISMRPTGANPQDRPAASFRHPGQSGFDLLTWTRMNRSALLRAVLILVRAWFAAGQPSPKQGVSFGSFESWERIVGGVLDTAGVEGFLGDLRAWRSETDFDTQYWNAHLAWLREEFGTAPFKTGAVRDKAVVEMGNFPAPPHLDDPTDKSFGKKLGEAYSRMRGRRMGDGLSIERVATAHGHVALWTVRSVDDLPPSGGAGPAGPDSGPSTPDTGPDNPQPVDKGVDIVQAGEVMTSKTDIDRDIRTDECLCSRAERGYCHADNCHGGADILDEEMSLEAGLLTFDLETGDAGDLHKRGPGYVRIGATAENDEPVVTHDGDSQDVAENVTTKFWTTGQSTITGHNIMAFDLPALVNAGTITFPEIHRMAGDGRFFDALLAARYVDPPMARDKGVDAERKYDLGTLGHTYGLGEKLTDVSKPLAKKYGGWDHIPIDDSEDGQAFKAYMVQDVELSRRLYHALMTKLGGTVPEYLVREHRIAAIAAQISHNGFRVDEPELERRVEQVNRMKADNLAWLAEHAGVPLTDPKGKAYASPLATNAGKDAIGAALVAAGVPERALWRTPRSGALQLSGEVMLHYSREYGQGNPQVTAIAKRVYRIVGARSVYQTAMDHLGPNGRVHPKIGFQQATGRWSVTQPGLTVFGKRGGRHVEREVFLPEPGEVIISADLSQVDMRAVAGLSQDQAYIRMLESEDPHTEIAIALFGDAKFRETAKAVGHGWNYGESLRRISEDNEIDPKLVRQFDTSMRERFPRLVQWRDEVREIGESGVLLDNGFGRKMRPDPRRAHTQAPALMGQGAARDIMMSGILRLPAELRPMLRGVVHDEVLLSVPEDSHVEIGRMVVEALSFTWKGVSILADVSKPGHTWGACYSK